MPSFSDRFENRRRLLKWLSGSPLLGDLGIGAGFALGAPNRPSLLAGTAHAQQGCPPSNSL